MWAVAVAFFWILVGGLAFGGAVFGILAIIVVALIAELFSYSQQAEKKADAANKEAERNADAAKKKADRLSRFPQPRCDLDANAEIASIETSKMPDWEKYLDNSQIADLALEPYRAAGDALTPEIMDEISYSARKEQFLKDFSSVKIAARAEYARRREAEKKLADEKDNALRLLNDFKKTK